MARVPTLPKTRQTNGPPGTSHCLNGDGNQDEDWKHCFYLEGVAVALNHFLQ